MLTKKDGARLIKPIPFETLQFRTPYTERWLCNGETTVFFSDVAKKSGVIAERYSFCGKKFLRISCAETDMYSNALILQKYMKKISATDVEYSFLPCQPKDLSSTKNAVWMGYLNHQICDSFEKIEHWFDAGAKDDFPCDELTFHPPFLVDEKGARNWLGYDMRERPGLYAIAEDNIIVRTGQAMNLAQRPRAYFYPISKDKNRESSHYKVSYYENMITGKHEYKIAFIPLPIARFKSWTALYNRIDTLEKKLNFELSPRDNRRGVGERELVTDLPF